MDIKVTPKNWLFRFERFWLNDPSYVDKFKQWWKDIEIYNTSLMHKFQYKLKILKAQIQKWNKEEFGNIFEAK